MPVVKKNVLYKQFLKFRTQEAEDKYKKYKNRLTNILKSVKKRYYGDLLEFHKNDVKGTWKILKSIIGNKKSNNSYPDEFDRDGMKISGNKNIADAFNNFFVNIGPNLSKKINNDCCDFTSFMPNNMPNSLLLTPVDVREIIQTTNNFKNKHSTDCDDLSMTIIKRLIPYTAQPLCHIFNLSLFSGVVPDRLKFAKVIPLFKAGDNKIFSNYRPISLLPQFSKILERVFNKRLVAFTEKFNILNPSQYGFRKKHSTSTAILELLEHITESIDDSKYCMGIFVDLKKAFDTINHNILLQKLDMMGVRGVANDWIKSYLNNRKQYVHLNDTKSSEETISCGVPQGSILGPILFILYINDLCRVSKQIKMILFADDTNLILSHNNLKSLTGEINCELKKISSWFKSNKLSLNTQKTNYMLITNKVINEDIRVSIDENSIERVDNTKFLGVYLDDKLKWTKHIAHIKNKISKNIAILNKVRDCIQEKALITLYRTLIEPYLNYCCESWGLTSTTSITPIVTLQKKAVRIIAQESYLATTNPLFAKYKILKIEDLVTLNILIKMYESKQHNLPKNLQTISNRSRIIHSNRFPENYAISYCRTLPRSRAFSIIGPKLWNSLKPEIKKLPTLRLFKMNCKKQFLQKYDNMIDTHRS